MLQLDIFKPELESKIEAICASYAANLKSDYGLKGSLKDFENYFDSVADLEAIKLKQYLSEHPNLIVLS